MKMDDETIFLSAEHLAERFDCSPRTVARWIATGKIPSIKVGRLRRANLADARRALMVEHAASRRDFTEAVAKLNVATLALNEARIIIGLREPDRRGAPHHG